MSRTAFNTLAISLARMEMLKDTKTLYYLIMGFINKQNIKSYIKTFWKGFSDIKIMYTICTNFQSQRNVPAV